jgi:hypothetical protein
MYFVLLLWCFYFILIKCLLFRYNIIYIPAVLIQTNLYNTTIWKKALQLLFKEYLRKKVEDTKGPITSRNSKKGDREYNRQQKTMICKILHTQLKIEQHELH